MASHSLIEEMLVDIATFGSKAIDEYISLPRNKRICYVKEENGKASKVTPVDIDVCAYAMRRVPDTLGPGVELDFEELPQLTLIRNTDSSRQKKSAPPHRKRNATRKVRLDPIDITSHAVEMIKGSDSKNPYIDASGKYRYPATLVSYVEHGTPSVFAVGYYTSDVFHGSVAEGVFLNGDRHHVDTEQSDLIFDLDRNLDRIEEAGGNRGNFVAMAIYLILQGKLCGGIHPADRSYEIDCIVAILNSLRAIVTDETGKPYRSENGAAKAVWAFSKDRHADIFSRCL